MTLARKTGEVRFVAAGPMVYPAGEYDPAVTYTRTTLSVPMVLCDTLYYVLNKKGSFKGINPKTDYATNKAKATWIMMDQMKYAFIEVLMTNFAKLASAVFHGNYMFSQQGTNAVGAATNDYTKFGTDAFTPNLMMDFLKGAFCCLDAYIKGHVEADSGSIGGFDIGNGKLGISDGIEGATNGMFLTNNFIGFNGANKQTLFGIYDILGSRRLGQLIDTTSSAWDVNVGLVFDIRNGYHNYAFTGRGDGILNGVIEGYKVNWIPFTKNNEAAYINFSNGKYIEVISSYSDCYLMLPKLADIRSSLGLSSTDTRDFAVKLTIAKRAGNDVRLYGRNSDFTVNGGSVDNDQHPYLRNNNFGDTKYWEMANGDVIEVLLTYSGGQYNAYTINLSR